MLERAETAEAKPRAYADRFTPSRPSLLAPGERWAGSFSGPGRPPEGVPVRGVVGRFVVEGPVPRGFVRNFLCVSRRYPRLR